MTVVSDSYQLRMGMEGGKRVTSELTSVGEAGKKSFKKVEDAAAQTTLGMRVMTRYIIGNLLPAFGAIQIGRSLLANIQTLEKMDTRLRRLSGSAESYAQNQVYLSEQASRLNVDLTVLGDSYARLLNLQNSGVIDGGQVKSLLEGLVDARAALGASDADLDRVLFGLSQALSAGVVRAEDFNQVVEPLPGLLQQLDKASGQAAGGFRRLVVEGQVTSDYFAKVLPAALKSYEGAAEGMQGTSVAAFTEMNNAWLELSRSIGESGVVTALAGVFGGLSVVIDGAADGTRHLREELSRLLSLMPSFDEAFARRVDSAPRLSKVDFGPTADSSARGEGGVRTAAFQARLQDQMNAIGKAESGSGLLLSPDGLRSVVLPPKAPSKLPSSSVSSPSSRPASDSADKQSADDAKRAAQAIRDVTEALKFKTEQLSRTESEQELYNNLQRAGVDLASDAGQEIAALSASYDLMSKAIAQNRAEMERIQRTADAVGDAFASAFEKASLEGDSLRSVIYGLAKDIEAMLFRSAVSDPLKAAISGGVSSLLGAGSFAVSSGNSGAAFRAALNPGLYGPGFASGGSFTVGGSGGTDTTPVSFWATRGEKVTVETPGQQKSGGDTIITLDLRGSNGDASIEAAVRRGIAQAAPHLVNASVRKVVDLNNRKPGFLR
jgi:tape measure domain-containing protein